MSQHSALLAHPFERVCDPIEKIVHEMGYETARTPENMVVTIPLGQVVFSLHTQGTQVGFSSPTGPQLQMLKDLYARRFNVLGLDAGIRWQTPADGRAPLNQSRCTVQSLTRISPNFARLRLTGNFSAFAQPESGLHFRLLMGPEGAGLPSLDDNGLTHWPGGQEAWHRPVYTVRAIGPDADWMDVDIVLHEGGRVTDWCARVAPGDRIALTGPSGSKMPTAQNLILLGDETALPVIMRICDGMPKGTRVDAVLALRSHADLQSPADPTHITIDTCAMDDDQALLQALASRLAQSPDAQVFFAAEKSVAALARDLIKASSMPASQARAAAYWTREESHDRSVESES